MELLLWHQVEVHLLPKPEVSQIPGSAPDKLRLTFLYLVVDVQGALVRGKKVDVEHQLEGGNATQEGGSGEGGGFRARPSPPCQEDPSTHPL